MYQIASNQGFRPPMMRFPGGSHNGHSHPGTLRARPDATVGHRPSWRGPFGMFGGREAVKGFAIDMNRNGRYDSGRDGVLTFDLNRDGRYDAKDVQSTNNMMKAAGGDFDFNGNGKTSWSEKIMGAKYRQKYSQMDRNRDGRLSGAEIARGGGRVWMDGDRNGQIGRGETHSPFRIPSIDGRGPLRLDGVDPTSRRGHTSRGYPGGRMRPGPRYPGSQNQHGLLLRCGHHHHHHYGRNVMPMMR